MKLTPRQAADKLNVNPSTIHNLIKKNPTIKTFSVGSGVKKKHILVDSVSLNEFAKSYKNRKKNNYKSPSTGSSVGILSKIENRLISLENKIDNLIKMWS